MHNAKIGGILAIISGAFGVLGGILGAIFSIYMIGSMYGQGYVYGTPPQFTQFMTIFYSAIGVFFAIVGILGIVGGVFALKRRRWGLALAGAIAGTVTFFPCGIPSIIYVTMAKPEFAAQQLPASPEQSIPGLS